MTGKLYIVGVGPGDKELLTVKAAKVLGSTGHIFVPISAEGKESLAYKSVREYIPDGTSVTQLFFPMVSDKNILQKHYSENYKKIESVLRQGKDVALITIGDPCTYSTSWPVFELAKNNALDIDVEVISGITSYADGAARASINLLEGNEIMSVVSSYDSPERIEAVIDVSDTVVFLKTYKKRETVLEILKKKDLIKQSVYIKRCGLEGEEIIYDILKIPAEPDYFSMIIMKKL